MAKLSISLFPVSQDIVTGLLIYLARDGVRIGFQEGINFNAKIRDVLVGPFDLAGTAP